MTPQQIIDMDKQVIEQLIHFMNTTTKVNGFNRGQIEEGKTEIVRLCNRIIGKAKSIGGSYFNEQKIFVSKIMKEIGE